MHSRKLLVGLLLLSSCGANHVAITKSDSNINLPLPLLNEENRLLLVRASSQELDRCIQNHGYSGYHTHIPSSLNKNQYPDAIPDLAVLNEKPGVNGYKLLKKIRDAENIDGPKNPLDDPYMKSLSQEELTRLSTVIWGTKIVSVPSATGGFVDVRADGCAHDADAAVYPQGWEELDVLRDGLLGTAMSNTYANVNFAKSLNEWKKCISSAGFEADRPKLLQDAIALKYQNKELSSEKVHQIEVSSARADYECQKRSGYANVAIPTLVSEMQKVIAEHSLELDQLRRIELTAVKNAKKILGASK